MYVVSYITVYMCLQSKQTNSFCCVKLENLTLDIFNDNIRF